MFSLAYFTRSNPGKTDTEPRKPLVSIPTGCPYSVVDPGEGPGAPAPPLFLDQIGAWRAEKIFFWDRASPLSQGFDDNPPPPPPPYLKVWIRYWYTGHVMEALRTDTLLSGAFTKTPFQLCQLKEKKKFYYSTQSNEVSASVRLTFYKNLLIGLETNACCPDWLVLVLWRFSVQKMKYSIVC